MSIKIKTISTVQLPPPKCRKNLFHVVLTRRGESLRFAVFFCAKHGFTVRICRSSSAKSHAAPALFACKRAHNASVCYQLFAGAGFGAWRLFLFVLFILIELIKSFTRER